MTSKMDEQRELEGKSEWPVIVHALLTNPETMGENALCFLLKFQKYKLDLLKHIMR
jgi:hypothetical protein